MLSLLVIVGGIKGVARLMQWIVPLMALLWVGCSIVICLWHIGQIPEVIVTIVKSAFGWQEAAAGAAGYTLSGPLPAAFNAVCFLMKRAWVQRLTPRPRPRHGLRIPPHKALCR